MADSSKCDILYSTLRAFSRPFFYLHRPPLLSSPQHGIIRPQCALGRWAWSTVQLQGSMGIQRVADLFLAL